MCDPVAVIIVGITRSLLTVSCPLLSFQTFVSSRESQEVKTRDPRVPEPRVNIASQIFSRPPTPRSTCHIFPEETNAFLYGISMTEYTELQNSVCLNKLNMTFSI